MKKLISLVLIGCMLSGCSGLRVHRMDVEQGNVFTQRDISRLRLGMSEMEVKDIMGNPVLVNLFRSNRVDYVYTFQPGYGDLIEKRVICIFKNGRLKEVLSGEQIRPAAAVI